MSYRLLPPLLLTLVALTQIVLVRTLDLTPWKGGGFGMFSTLDHIAYRHIDAVVDAPGRSEALDIPDSLQDEAARAAACPTDALLRRLAEKIADRERRNRRPVARVTLTAWRTEFNRDTLRAAEVRLRVFVYLAESNGPRVDESTSRLSKGSAE
jgi:hypothetical protein